MFAKRNGQLTSLTFHRLVKNLSQDELGIAIGLSGSYVSRIERGLVPVPERVRDAIMRTLGETALTDSLPAALNQIKPPNASGRNDQA